MGSPGWPELAFWTASIESSRIALAILLSCFFNSASMKKTPLRIFEKNNHTEKRQYLERITRRTIPATAGMVLEWKYLKQVWCIGILSAHRLIESRGIHLALL